MHRLKGLGGLTNSVIHGSIRPQIGVSHGLATYVPKLGLVTL